MEKPKEEVKKVEEPKKLSLIEQTNQAAERAEKAIEVIKGYEKMLSEQKLAGTADAKPTTVPEKTEAEKESEARIKDIGQATGAKWAKDEEK